MNTICINLIVIFIFFTKLTFKCTNVESTDELNSKKVVFLHNHTLTDV